MKDAYSEQNRAEKISGLLQIRLDADAFKRQLTTFCLISPETLDPVDVGSKGRTK